jgi:hypothetical protein
MLVEMPLQRVAAHRSRDETQRPQPTDHRDRSGTKQSASGSAYAAHMTRYAFTGDRSNNFAQHGLSPLLQKRRMAHNVPSLRKPIDLSVLQRALQ